jgi:hypothetical protein
MFQPYGHHQACRHKNIKESKIIPKEAPALQMLLCNGCLNVISIYTLYEEE